MSTHLVLFYAKWTKFIALKKYSTLPKAPELEPHYQMQFSVILWTPFLGVV